MEEPPVLVASSPFLGSLPGLCVAGSLPHGVVKHPKVVPSLDPGTTAAKFKIDPGIPSSEATKRTCNTVHPKSVSNHRFDDHGWISNDHG